MSSGASSTEPQSSSNAAGAPSVPNGKGTTSPPRVTQQDASVELKTMKRAIPLGEDIMQIARIGEIGAMQNLFNEKKFNASYKDEEGITPLHVRIHVFIPKSWDPVVPYECPLTIATVLSGPQSTTSTPCASFCWSLGPTSTPKEETR